MCLMGSGQQLVEGGLAVVSDRANCALLESMVLIERQPRLCGYQRSIEPLASSGYCTIVQYATVRLARSRRAFANS